MHEASLFSLLGSLALGWVGTVRPAGLLCHDSLVVLGGNDVRGLRAVPFVAIRLSAPCHCDQALLESTRQHTLCFLIALTTSVRHQDLAPKSSPYLTANSSAFHQLHLIVTYLFD